MDWQVPVVKRIHEFDRDSLALQPYPRHSQSFADCLLGSSPLTISAGVQHVIVLLCNYVRAG